MIFRKRHQNKFTAISNGVCVDTSISTDARWCLWYLLTKPEDWEVRINDVRQVSGWGRDKAYKVVNELVAAKYLVVSQLRANDGQFDAISYDVYEEPFTGLPFTEKPDTVKPNAENKEHTKDLRIPRTEKEPKTERNISYDADFEEFWAAYPKRPNNAKKPARLKYIAARRRGVSHETIMAGVNIYALNRVNENPMFTKQAETWLNKECWDNEFEVKVGPEPQAVSDEMLDQLVDAFPGRMNNPLDVKHLVGIELRNGATLASICEAAKKYALLLKERRSEGFEEAPANLEKWIKFKWREMDDYEFRRVGMDNRLTVRPKRVKK